MSENRRKLEKILLQHEELLQAANEDMESSAKNQIEQLRTLLRDKDSEMSQNSATLQELLKSKELNISDLSSQINILQEKVSSMDAVSERLNSALEQTKLLEPLNLELEKAKEEVASLISQIRQLEEESDVLKKSTESDKVQTSRLQEKLAESENECEKLKLQMEDFTTIINLNKEHLELLDLMKLEITELKKALDQKEKFILELHAADEKAIDSANAKAYEHQQITEELNKQFQALQTELIIVKSTVDAKDEQIVQLEKARSILITSESQLKSAIEEKELNILSKESELVTLRSSLTEKESCVSKIQEECLEFERAKEEIARKLIATQEDLSAIHQVKDQCIAELQEEIEQAKFNMTAKDAEWELKTQELSTKLEAAHSEFEELRNAITAKHEHVLQLEQAQNQWVTEESSLKLVVDENEKRLAAQEKELEMMRNSLDSKEIRIGELQEELKQISLNLNVQDSEMKQTNRELSESLKSAQSELDEFKARLLQANLLSTEWEQKNSDLSNQLDIAKNKLQAINCTLETQEEQVRQLNEEMKKKQSFVEESQQQLRDSELQLTATKQLLSDNETQISAFKESVSSLETTTTESTRQIELLNHSLAVKESVIIDLQGEVARNGQLMTEIQTSAEEQRQQLLVEKDTLTEQYKSQLSSVESEWKRVVAELNDKLSIMEKTAEESKLQFVTKEDAIRELETNYSAEIQKISQTSAAASSLTQSLENELLEKKNELDGAIARATELEMKLKTFINQIAQNESEKEILRTENDKLREYLESKKIETSSLEFMENQIKVKVVLSVFM